MEEESVGKLIITFYGGYNYTVESEGRISASQLKAAIDRLNNEITLRQITEVLMGVLAAQQNPRLVIPGTDLLRR